MIRAAIVIIVKTWKQPRYPSIGEWINKLWYNQTMKYYSASKRKRLSNHEKMRRKLQCILLKSKPLRKAIYCVVSYMTFRER